MNIGITMNIGIHNFSFHSVSVENEEPIERQFNEADQDVQRYINHILKEALTPPNGQQIRGRYFNFRSDNERVVSNLLSVIEEDVDEECWNSVALDNAKKLLEAERQAQSNISSLNTQIRKGCLLQAKYTINGAKWIALIKIDDNTFLDEEMMKLKQGLPMDTRMQKVALVKFNNDHSVESLILSDTNATISKYWREDFLAADSIRSDEVNTKNAFEETDKLLRKHIREVSKQDYYFLRNQVILSFRQESLDFNNLVDSISNYSPIRPELNAQKLSTLVAELRNLPNKSRGFDTQFTIEPKVIKAKINNRISIDENFELRVLRDIDDLTTKIDAAIDDQGRKFVKIYSDDGYNTFKRN